MINQNKRIITLLFIFSLAYEANAAATDALVAPDAGLRDDLAYLRDHDVIRISLSTWPLSSDAIESALDKANIIRPYQQTVINRVRARLHQLQGGSVGVSLSSARERNLGYFGHKELSQQRATFSYADGNEHYAYRGQINAIAHPLGRHVNHANLDGSYIGMKLYGQWLSFGTLDHYWGPGNTGSLILNDTAHPIIGFTIQRAKQTAFQTPFLSWLGPWNYQLSIGELRHYTSVPQAKLINMRVSAQPFSFLEIGAHRVIQWGGKGRPHNFRNLVNALTSKDENVYAGTGVIEPGNQIAGLDVRLSLKPVIDLPMSLYAQMIGEDEAGYFPSKKAYLAGLDGSFYTGSGQINWSLELADTRTEFGRKPSVIYRHHIYRDGYYQYGLPLGYYTGGDAQVAALNLAYLDQNDARYTARIWHSSVNPNNQTQNALFPRKARPVGIELGWQNQFSDKINLAVKGWFVQDNMDKNQRSKGLRASFQYHF